MSEIRAGHPFTAYRTKVRPEWLDYNGHVNDSAYAVICTEANELLLEDLGLSETYRSSTGCSLYTVEAHLRYLGEVGPAAELRAETFVVEADSKRLRVHTTLYVADQAVLTGEHLYLHVDQSTGRVTPFPADRGEVVGSTLAAHAGLDRPPHLGLGVGAPRPGR
ncbi:MAG: thioesterase family protein [Marmoricola sp.]